MRLEMVGGWREPECSYAAARDARPGMSRRRSGALAVTSFTLNEHSGGLQAADVRRGGRDDRGDVYREQNRSRRPAAGLPLEAEGEGKPVAGEQLEPPGAELRRRRQRALSGVAEDPKAVTDLEQGAA